MKKMKWILLAGLAAAVVAAGAWSPTANQVDTTGTVVAFEETKQNSIPTILPPL